MIGVLIVIQIVIVALLLVFILLQQSGGDGVANLGNKSGKDILTQRGPAGLVVKITMCLGIMLMLNSLAIARLDYVNDAKARSFIQQTEKNGGNIEIKDSPGGYVKPPRGD